VLINVPEVADEDEALPHDPLYQTALLRSLVCVTRYGRVVSAHVLQLLAASRARTRK
jgi:hypothetical protein